MARETVLHRVRTALGRTAGQAPAPVPPVYMRSPEWTVEERITRFRDAFEALGGKMDRAGSYAEARDRVASILGGRRGFVSNAPFLRECGIDALPGVSGPYGTTADTRAAASSLEAGVTCADYALAETGTLVILSSPAESRLISLLPPAHIAVVPSSRLLTNLDELFAILPDPAAQTSAMLMITGPSRTADIEQILVRGVHGPGEIHVVLVDSETGK